MIRLSYGIHGLQEHRLSGACVTLDAMFLARFSRVSFRPSAVVLCVYFYADIGSVSFVDHKAGQVLDGIQGLSSFSDEHIPISSAVETRCSEDAFLVKGGT